MIIFRASSYPFLWTLWSSNLLHVNENVGKKSGCLKPKCVSDREIDENIFRSLLPRSDLRLSWCISIESFAIRTLQFQGAATWILQQKMLLENFQNKDSWERHWTGTFDSCFNRRRLHRKSINSHKFQIDRNDVVFTCYQGDISVWILRTMLFLPKEAHCEPNPTSFCVNSYWLWINVADYAKNFIVDVWSGPELIKCFKIHE